MLDVIAIMDFGHDPHFYRLMRDARRVADMSYPEYVAYMEAEERKRVESTRAYQRKLREYLDCMEHADELYFFGGRRRRPKGQRLRLEPKQVPAFNSTPLPGLPNECNFIPFHFPRQVW